MPNFSTSLVFVDTATKCFATDCVVETREFSGTPEPPQKAHSFAVASSTMMAVKHRSVKSIEQAIGAED
jgi:hypothetical protein